MKKPTFVILATIAFNTLYAQKLPNIQQVSLRAPVNIKIDGKATEWSNQFKAYNTATDVYYNLANDDENLYLVLKTQQYLVINNIIKHGVRFTINHSIDKKDASPLVICYPAMEQKDRGPILDVLGSRYYEAGKKAADNSVEALNSMVKARSKFIRVKGVSDLSEDKIAIYNDKGIAAVSVFEIPLAYVYELAIPLKYLSLNARQGAAFSYEIKINFPDPSEKLPPPPPPNGLVIIDPKGAGVTDFWGEYILAK